MTEKKSYQTIDEYIALQDEKVQPILMEVRKTIGLVLPQCQEKISFSMPTWWNKRNIIHMAAMKKHLGIYPGSGAVEFFEPELKQRKLHYSKGAIQIPYGEDMQLEFITRIAQWCKENNG